MTYKKALPTAIQGIGVIALLVSSQGAMAADWDLSGFIRQEGAYSLDNGGRENYWNQGGNMYNGNPTDNVVHEIAGIVPTEITRPKELEEDNDWNLMMTRAQLDIDA